MAPQIIFHPGPIESAIAASIHEGRSLACFISGDYALLCALLRLLLLC